MNRTLQMIFLLLITLSAGAQSGIIRGKITTSDGEPAVGVTARIKGQHKTAISDEQGKFTLSGLKAGNFQMEFSMIGFEGVTQQVQVTEGQETVTTLQLKVSGKELQEVTIRAARQKLVRPNSEYVAKMPLKNLENAQSYSVVSGELMKQQLAFTVDDAMKNVAGVSRLWEATYRTGSGGTWFVSRGFSTQPRARNGVAGNVISNVDINNIDRLEVIKGPSATLFGNVISTYGGLINRITKKPYQIVGGEVDYAGGSYGFSRVSFDVNTPLDKDRSLLLRTNGAVGRRNSFQDYGYVKNYAFAPSLSYQVNDKLSIHLDAELVGTENSSGSQNIYFLSPSAVKSTLSGALAGLGYNAATINALLAGAPKTMKEAYGTDRADEIKLDYNRSYLSNDLVNKTNSANFFGEIRYKMSDAWNMQTTVSTGSASSNGPLPYLYLLPNALPAFISSALSGGTPSFGTPGHDQMARMVWRVVGEENNLQIQHNFIGDFKIGKMRNRFVGGLDYYHYKQRTTYNRFTGRLFGFPFADAFDVVNTSGNVPNYGHLNKAKVDSAFASGPSGNLNYNNDINIYSAYANDVWNITEQLLVTAGLRLDHFDNKGAYNPVSGTYAGAFKQTALVPKFGLIYQPLKDRLSLFGNYQTSFTNQTGLDVNGNTFKPEHAFQWEAGAKLNLLGDRLTGTLSYYDILVKDIVRADPANPLFNIQDGEQSSKGFEAEIQAVPTEGLNIVAGYGYNKSELRKTDASVEGRRPVDAGPKSSANLWIAYTFRNGSLKGFGIAGGGKYAGEAYALDNNNDGKFILPSYTLIDAALSYDHPRFRITAKVNNITAQKYWVGWTTMNPQMLRQFIGSLAFKF